MKNKITCSLLGVLALGLLSCAAEPTPKKVPLDRIKTLSERSSMLSEARVDILFIIDDSGSMSSYQQELRRNVSKFSNALVNIPFIDFHFGVITTDTPRNGRLIHSLGETYVSRKSSDVRSSIEQRMIVGTSGSAQEMFFNNLKSALTEPNLSGSNKGFYREDAILAIFFLSDTEDQNNLVGPSEFADFLVRLKKGMKEKIVVGGALANIGPGCRGEMRDPDRIVDFMSIFNAIPIDLCGPNYGAELAAVAAKIIERASVFYLNTLPDPRTITVSFGTQVIPNHPLTGWVYSSAKNAVILGPEINLKIEKGAQISITFAQAENEP